MYLNSTRKREISNVQQKFVFFFITVFEVNTRMLSGQRKCVFIKTKAYALLKEAGQDCKISSKRQESFRDSSKFTPPRQNRNTQKQPKWVRQKDEWSRHTRSRTMPDRGDCIRGLRIHFKILSKKPFHGLYRSRIFCTTFRCFFSFSLPRSARNTRAPDTLPHTRSTRKPNINKQALYIEGARRVGNPEDIRVEFCNRNQHSTSQTNKEKELKYVTSVWQRYSEEIESQDALCPVCFPLGVYSTQGTLLLCHLYLDRAGCEHKCWVYVMFYSAPVSPFTMVFAISNWRTVCEK